MPFLKGSRAKKKYYFCLSDEDWNWLMNQVMLTVVRGWGRDLFSRTGGSFNGKNFSIFSRLVFDHPDGGRVSRGAFGRCFQIQFSVNNRSFLCDKNVWKLINQLHFRDESRYITFVSTSAAALPMPIDVPEAPERSDFLGAALLIKVSYKDDNRRVKLCRWFDSTLTSPPSSSSSWTPPWPASSSALFQKRNQPLKQQSPLVTSHLVSHLSLVLTPTAWLPAESRKKTIK